MKKSGWKIVHMAYDDNYSRMVYVFENEKGDQKIRSWDEEEQEWISGPAIPTN